MKNKSVTFLLISLLCLLGCGTNSMTDTISDLTAKAEA